jgi:hypothetical protein
MLSTLVGSGVWMTSEDAGQNRSFSPNTRVVARRYEGLPHRQCNRVEIQPDDDGVHLMFNDNSKTLHKDKMRLRINSQRYLVLPRRMTLHIHHR